jgi:hypothetical protein
MVPARSFFLTKSFPKTGEGGFGQKAPWQQGICDSEKGGKKEKEKAQKFQGTKKLRGPSGGSSSIAQTDRNRPRK